MTQNKKRSGRRLFLVGLGTLGVSYFYAFAKNYKPSELQIQEVGKDLDILARGNKRISLSHLAASKELIYGSYAQYKDNQFPQDKELQAAFVRECALLVIGFFGVSISVQKNIYDFKEPDFCINFASKNNLIIRGTPLVWNEFNAPWVVEKFKDPSTTSNEIEEIFINHIHTVVNRYVGQLHSWDVVNEVINPEDGRADGLKDTRISGVRGEKYPTWLNFLGPDYIDRAFRLAAQADPHTMLVYNENGLSYDYAWQDRRRHAVLKLIESLKAKGTPIHALGIQGHLDASQNKDFNPKKFRQFLSEIAGMGLKILITELDVRDHNLPAYISQRDRLVAQAYYEYLSVALDEPEVIAVINWGLSDRYTWLSNFAPRKDGKPVRPLPLDEQLNYKPAWYAMAKAFQEAPIHQPHKQFKTI